MIQDKISVELAEGVVFDRALDAEGKTLVERIENLQAALGDLLLRAKEVFGDDDAERDTETLRAVNRFGQIIAEADTKAA